MMAFDTVSFIQKLIQCPSVTPLDSGAMAVLTGVLGPLGFSCDSMPFGDVFNLYAVRRGGAGPHLCFAGHTDVVVPGPAWRYDPFGGIVADGFIHGRGAVDMKGAIGCFVGAVSNFLDVYPDFPGTLSFLITGDEEGPGVNGTRRVLDVLMARGIDVDGCVIGEPASTCSIGDTIKVGRRGSLTAVITVRGVQGHAAYPHLAHNPIPVLARCIDVITNPILDNGIGPFDPSHLEVVQVRTRPDGPSNVIPSMAAATINVRFNPVHTRESLKNAITHLCAPLVQGPFRFDIQVSDGGSDPFLSSPGPIHTVAMDAITDVTGRAPDQVTTGGTSDGRFLKDLCPVVEIGLCSGLAHHVDERVSVSDLGVLEKIYSRLLHRFFALTGPGNGV